MKKVKILHFREKHQDRMSFVRLMAENSSDIGLKKAKLLQDDMLDGNPILYEVRDDKSNIFFS